MSVATNVATPQLEPKVKESWSRTERYKGNLRHKWTICDFLSRVKTGKPLKSPRFVVPINCNGETKNPSFCLKLFLDDSSDFIGIYLQPVEDSIVTSFCFSLQKADGSSSAKIGFESNEKTQEKPDLGFERAFKKSDIMDKEKGFIIENSLTIICDLEVRHSDFSIGGVGAYLDFEISNFPSLADDLSKLRENASTCDVVLKCQGETFKCHKNILASRSEVFAAMFLHPETLESITNEVLIEDTDPETLGLLVNFIYTDKLESQANGDLTIKLLPMSEKYNLPKLKAICEQAICEQMTESNALDSLLQAHIFDAKNLKQEALKFVFRNRKQLCKSDKWIMMKKDYPSLVVEVLSLAIDV